MGTSRLSSVLELQQEFCWNTLAHRPSKCLLVCASLLTIKTPTVSLPWKHTQIHTKGRELKERGPSKSPPSRCLSYSILSTLEIFRMAIRDISWARNCLTRRPGASGGKVRPGRKAEGSRTTHPWDLTWCSRKEANESFCLVLPVPPLFALVPGNFRKNRGNFCLLSMEKTTLWN